jgi:selenocysteine-specific elongation factor
MLKKDLAIFNDDKFIIRNNMGTVGGGKIICVENLSNFNNEKLTYYLRNINAHVEKKLETIIQEKKIVSIERLQTLSGLSKNKIFNNIEKTEVITFQLKNKNQYLAKKQFIMDLSKRMFLRINEYHSQYPLRHGISASIINESIENRISIAQLINQKNIILKEGVISNPNFKIGIPSKDKREIDSYIKSLEENPFNPPTDKHPNKELLNYLIKIGAIIQSSNNIYYSFNSFNEIKAKVLELNKKHKKININILRENLKISRKYCLAILDKMEEENLIIRTKI